MIAVQFGSPVAARRLILSVAGGLLLAAGWGGCSSQRLGPDTPVVALTDLQNAGLKTRWIQQVPLAVNHGEKPKNLWQAGDALLVLTNQNQLHSFSTANGTTNYTCDLDKKVMRPFAPVDLDKSMLAVADETGVILVDKSSGVARNKALFDFSAATRPILNGKYFYIGGIHGFFYCVYAEYQGNYKESPSSDPKPFVIGHRNWILRSPTDANDSFPSAPVVVAGNHIVIASQKGLLWNVAGDDGDNVWMYRKVNGEVAADLMSDQVRVYVSCLNNYLYAFEAMTGTPSWSTRLEGKLDQAAVAVGKSILLPTTGKGLYALSPNDGQIKWLVPGATRVVGAAENKIFATNTTKDLLIINAQSGAVEQTIAVPNVKQYLPGTGKTVVILTTDGRLTAIEPDAS